MPQKTSRGRSGREAPRKGRDTDLKRQTTTEPN